MPLRRRTLLILSQTFPPDPAAVGQYMAAAGAEMGRRGYRVVVLTANRGYDDPSIRFAPAEHMDGMEVIRIPASSFGKRSILLRIAATASFATQCFVRGVNVDDLGGVLFSTSPPLIGFVGGAIAWLRRAPAAYWAMDLNPDQLVALGKLRPESFVTRVLEWANRRMLRGAALIITLDRFMAERIARRRPTAPIAIIPPWPHERLLDAGAREGNPFRERHAVRDKIVVMYSGNHTHSNPFRTVLEAARRLRDHPGLHFMFIGGGNAKPDVDDFKREHALANVTSLPYQPASEVRHSIAAGDVHLVTMGDAMTGVIHPSKVYAAMAAGRPILYLGPRESHVADILACAPIGWSIAHGDVDGAEAALRRIGALSFDELDARGAAAQQLVAAEFAERIHLARTGDLLEKMIAAR